ncbi:MAG: NAD(P)/FAD-dependent oxidoreductase [Myxococcota bacterium]
MGTTTLILGGGVGGLATARALRTRLGREHSVVLVERETEHRFAPSLLWVLTGDRRPEDFARPMERLSARGVQVVRGEIAGIDPARRAVTLADGRAFEGDHLVVALGAEHDKSAQAGLAEAGHCLYDVEGAETIRDALLRLERGRVVVLTAAPAYKCPAAPYEAAMLIEARLRSLGRREHASVAIYAAEPAPMGTAGPEVSAALRGMLGQKDIDYHPEHVLERAEPGQLHFKNGTSATFDLLAYVPVHRAPATVVEAGLVNATGWVPVDRGTLATSHPGVYAIGDVTVIPLTMGRPLPKAGVFAHAQAEVVAANIAREVTGKGEPRTFDGHGGCFVEVGDGRAAYGSGDFYAEPRPAVSLRAPSFVWHLGKVWFEKSWLWRHP